MPITSNVSGVLHELDVVTSNAGGVTHELDLVHSNVGGVLKEIHSGFKPPESVTLYQYKCNNSGLTTTSETAVLGDNAIMFGTKKYNHYEVGKVSYPYIEDDTPKRWMDLEFVAQSKMIVNVSLDSSVDDSHYSNHGAGYVTRTKKSGVPSYSTSESILTFTGSTVTKDIILEKGETLYLRFMGYGYVGDFDSSTEEWTYHDEWNTIYDLKLTFSK